MSPRALALALLIAACDEDSETFDAGRTDAMPDTSDSNVCNVFCPASVTAVSLDLSCADAAVIDASFGGSCADAAATCGLQDPNLVPFKDCRHVLVYPATVGTCTVALSFDDDASYLGQSVISEGPRNACCQNGILTATGLTVGDASCE